MFQFSEEAYGSESKIIVMDFTGGTDIYNGLGEKLAGLDIGILGEYFCVKALTVLFVGTVVFYSQTATTDNLSTMSDQPL